MDPLLERRLLLNRRQLFGRAAGGLGTAALASLLSPGLLAAPRRRDTGLGQGAALDALHHAPTAKRVIYLCMAGAPSQLETFDYKPALEARFDEADDALAGLPKSDRVQLERVLKRMLAGLEEAGASGS